MDEFAQALLIVHSGKIESLEYRRRRNRDLGIHCASPEIRLRSKTNIQEIMADAKLLGEIAQRSALIAFLSKAVECKVEHPLFWHGMGCVIRRPPSTPDRKSTRLNSSH